MNRSVEELLYNIESIVIYGAGEFGKVVFNKLELMGLSNKVIGFAVSEKDNIRNNFTKEIGDYIYYKDDVVIILAVSFENIDIIHKNAKELGFENIISCYDLDISKGEVEVIHRPHHYTHFLTMLNDKKEIHILDVGCGNNSIERVRKYCVSGVFYSGLDIGDCNLSENAKMKIDEYVTVDSSQFADAILSWEGKEDAVISSHNIEHCEKPLEVLKNMVRALKEKGMLYISFPSEESENFPRGYTGTLNFFDDWTHREVPNWKTIIQSLLDEGMEIIYSCKNYQPEYMKEIGRLNLEESKKQKRVLPGIWEYYGFESIIWARKI